MSAVDSAGALHPQDRLLIVEALAYWASGHGSLSRPTDTADRRAHRAAELAEDLLDAESVEGSVHEAIDAEWSGTERDDTETDDTEGVDSKANGTAGDDAEGDGVGEYVLVTTESTGGESDEADA